MPSIFTKRILVVFMSFLLLFILSCSSTDEPEEKKETQISRDEAQATLNESAVYLVAIANFLTEDMTRAAQGDIAYLSDASGIGFNILNRETRTGLKLTKPQGTADEDTVYYNGNGCWIVMYEEIYDYYSAAINAEVCFQTVDENGYPTEANDVFDLDMTADFGYDYSEGEYVNNASIAYVRDFNMIGISGFATGGMVTVNGSESITEIFNYTYENESYSGNIKLTVTVKDLKFGLNSDWPEEGTINFTLDIKVTEEGRTYEYFLRGEMTFDGTSIVAVKFAGYDFDIDLENPYSTTKN